MILIALGANLPSRFGGPADTLHHAIEVINTQSDIKVTKQSHIYKSAPVPISDQPWYHNAVIAVETDLKPRALLDVLHDIEEEFGRVRIERNEARVLDLDIIAFNDSVLDEDGFIIPHPRMSERAFVLFPIKDIAPEWSHPITEVSVGDMIDALPEGQDIERLEVENHDAA